MPGPRTHRELSVEHLMLSRFRNYLWCRWYPQLRVASAFMPTASLRGASRCRWTSSEHREVGPGERSSMLKVQDADFALALGPLTCAPYIAGAGVWPYAGKPGSVQWPYPLFRRAETLDPTRPKSAGGRPPKH